MVTRGDNSGELVIGCKRCSILLVTRSDKKYLSVAGFCGIKTCSNYHFGFYSAKINLCIFWVLLIISVNNKCLYLNIEQSFAREG